MQDSPILTEVRGQLGCITLNRPQALNALSLAMIRELYRSLRAWQDDDAIQAVALRGMSKTGPFGALCAGGDIRFFHQAVLANDPALDDFFTEEYRLNHLIHTYAKPTLALMDGVVMGGGMGISQGCRYRVVTGRSKLAMPETTIGLFPDVGGGYFLSRCPGHAGEYLALTGQVLDGAQAVALGLADVLLPAEDLPALWHDLGEAGALAGDGIAARLALRPATHTATHLGSTAWPQDLQDLIDRYFSLPSALAIVQALEAADDPWAKATAALLRKRSPLMLEVSLAQVRRGRSLSLADALRMERGLMHQCFHSTHLGRPGPLSETMEGIRALAVDKDQAPRWNPARLEQVSPAMVQAYFESPWPAQQHPLRQLG